MLAIARHALLNRRMLGQIGFDFLVSRSAQAAVDKGLHIVFADRTGRAVISPGISPAVI